MTSYAAGTTRGTVHTNGASLNVRSGPSTKYAIIGRLANGVSVKIKGSSNGWYQIEYGSKKKAYVYGTYVKVTKNGYPVTGQVTNGGVPLRLRQKATTASQILAQIPRGSKIKITGKYNSGWLKATYKGKNGYVSAKYVKVTLPSSGSSASATPATGNTGTSSSYRYNKINLKVPFYSQFDSRWASKKLGKTSYTIRSSGCVVCGLAESESFLNGKTITPADMLKKLSFDSNGCVYWPSGYTSYTGSDYLEQIYRQLKNGKPVLVGAFTPSGKQHWVVASGHTAKGNSLSAKNIDVIDCSERYDSLADFLKTYSRFYKIVYHR